jgi:hypothetical protein
LRGTGRHSRHTRLQAIATGLVALAAAALLGACGGGDSSADADEPTGTFQVKVTEAKFPTLQRLGQTSLLQLGIRNTDDRTIPGLTVTFTVAGERGESSSLPFGFNDPQPELAQPDRPVWVLSETYPRLSGATTPGGASTASRKTFSFGALKPGKTVKAVWKLSAVRAGKFTLVYGIDAGLRGAAKAKTDGGVAPGGPFSTEITHRLPDTEVNDSGEIVEIEKEK